MSDDEHLLQNEWVLWEHRSAGHSGNKNSNQWKENMSELAYFNTVESFWKYFNHIPKPSEVFFDGECRKKVACSPTNNGGGEPIQKTIEEFSLFKKGIEPEWGDPNNVTGGEWFCRQSFEPDVLDLYWQNLVMGVIGETIEAAVDGDNNNEGSSSNHDYDCINGVRVVDKSRTYPVFKLEIWLKTRDDITKEKIRTKLLEIITDGQPTKQKTHPKFDWKDHSA